MTQIKKLSDLPPEPIINAADEVFDSPQENCPMQETQDEEVKRIKKVYYIDSNGVEIESVSEQEEVKLVIESENMSGEELIIPFHEGLILYKYQDQTIDPITEVLSHTISGDKDEIVLIPFVKSTDLVHNVELSVENQETCLFNAVSIEKDYSKSTWEYKINDFLPKTQTDKSGETESRLSKLTTTIGKYETIEVVSGPKNNTSKLKIKVDGLSTSGCDDHSEKVIYVSESEKSAGPEYELKVPYSTRNKYKRCVVQTCAGRTDLRINVYPDTVREFEASFTLAHREDAEIELKGSAVQLSDGGNEKSEISIAWDFVQKGYEFKIKSGDINITSSLKTKVKSELGAAEKFLKFYSELKDTLKNKFKLETKNSFGLFIEMSIKYADYWEESPSNYCVRQHELYFNGKAGAEKTVEFADRALSAICYPVGVFNKLVREHGYGGLSLNVKTTGEGKIEDAGVAVSTSNRTKRSELKLGGKIGGGMKIKAEGRFDINVETGKFLGWSASAKAHASISGRTGVYFLRESENGKDYFIARWNGLELFCDTYYYAGVSRSTTSKTPNELKEKGSLGRGSASGSEDKPFFKIDKRVGKFPLKK